MATLTICNETKDEIIETLKKNNITNPEKQADAFEDLAREQGHPLGSTEAYCFEIETTISPRGTASISSRRVIKCK